MLYLRKMHINCHFGWRVHPKLNTKKLHTGTDIAAEKGKSIVAAADGTVILSGEHGAYGNTIIINTTVDNIGNKNYNYYRPTVGRKS